MLATASVFAQPTKPTPSSYVSFESAVSLQTDVYLYNVEAGLFLTKGNNWGTRASVATNGQTAQTNENPYADLTSGKASVDGIPWTVAEQSNRTVGEATVSCYSFENKSGAGGVYNTADDWNAETGECTGIWVDGGTTRPYDKWVVTSLGDNTFKLSYLKTNTDGTFSIPEGFYGAQYLGTNGDTRTYIATGSENTTWALVSAEEFAAVQPKLNLYYVQVGLADLISKAKAQGTTADLSAYEALANAAPAATADEVNAQRADIIAAIELIGPAIELGEAIKAAKEVDAARDYSKFETLYTSSEATAEELTAATNLLKALTALKSAINSIAAGHDNSALEAVYGSDESTLAQVNDAKAIADAFLSLEQKIAEAKTTNPGLNYSEVEAVYNNAAATVADLTAAEAKLKEIVALADLSNATLANPANITSVIGYLEDLNAIAAGNGTVPKNGWTSTKKDGNFHINTWSTEGNPGNDGTNMTTPFIEYWKSKGNNLDDQKFYRDASKDPFQITVPVGAYKISANIRIYNESGAEYVKGVYLFANSNRTSLVQEGIDGPENVISGAVYGNYNSMLSYWKDGFETYAIVPTEGDLTFGVQTEGANFNWVASKGWKVEYLGNSFESLDFVRQNANLAIPAIDEDVVATKQVLNDFNAAKATYNTATTAEDIVKAYAALVPLAEELPANIAAWKAYQDALASAKAEEILVTGEGEYVDLLAEYVSSHKEGPNGDNEFPNGSSAYILNELSLTTEQVNAETEYIAQLVHDAITKSMKEGDDVTNMLVNPSFFDGFTGWTYSAGTAGGLKAFPDVERYGGTVECYQIVEGVPDGIYSLSCNAFERPGEIANIDRSTPTVVSLFMNEFQTPVQSILSDALPIDEAENYVNCFQSGSVGEDYVNTGGTTNIDSEWTDPESSLTYLVPNGMSGASYAFRAGRYLQKVYGLVEGGTMKIGLTSNGVSAHWVLWSNFKLTYEGKNEEALTFLIEDGAEKAGDFLDENDGAITTPAADALDDAVDAAYASLDNGTDAMWEALIALNSEMSAAKANVAAFAALNDAIASLDDAVSNNSEPTQKANDAYNELLDVISDEDAILELTTDGLKTLTEKVKEVTALMAIPGGYENATDEEPFDFTAVIVNPSFETGNLNGWTNTGTVEAQTQNNSEAVANKQGTYYCEKWHVNGTVGVEQTLSYLPAGTYEITAYAYSTASDAILYANKEQVSINDSKLYSIIVKIEEGENITFGVSWSDNGGLWTTMDDFKIKYFGTNSEQIPNAIADVETAEASAIVAIYSITGAPQKALQKGINIVKYANGKVAKVYVK